MGDVNGYLAERLGIVKRYNTGRGLPLPVMAPAVDEQWPPDVTFKKFSEVEMEYKRYLGEFVDIESVLNEV